MRLVVANPAKVRSTHDLLDLALETTGLHLGLKAAKFLHLLLSKVLFIVGVSLERQRVVGVLGALFMEDISAPIFPVWELGSVTTLVLHGGVVDLCARTLFGSGLDFESFEVSFVRGLHLHIVRVDDLVLFFNVEGIFVFQDLGLVELAVEVLLVV